MGFVVQDVLDVLSGVMVVIFKSDLKISHSLP